MHMNGVLGFYEICVLIGFKIQKAVLDENLNIVGLEYEHLETDLELFEVYRKKLYHGFERRYHQLLDQCFLKWAESPSWGRF